MGSPESLRVLGDLTLTERIGRGGMGEVWLGRRESGVEVAVKTLARSAKSVLQEDRFRREARLAATISHPNVVDVLELVEEPDGAMGLVMELLRGETLQASLLDRGRLPALQAVAVAVPILRALHHVHEKGIVHRDVKPSNVFLAVDANQRVIPKIFDFGIAKLPATRATITVDGSVLGTPHYMSPEQIRGRAEVDGRSDMFSVTLVVHEMLTGVRVFERPTALASLAAVLEHVVDPEPWLEPRLWLALARGIAKRPYERYGTCAEMADALRAAVRATDEQLAESLSDLRPGSVSMPAARSQQP